jgi:glycosyltransferase involved in cell wall biosynthesis
MGSQGRVAGYALETFPLRGIYRRRRFATVSEATKAEMVSEHRLDPEQIGVVWPGVKVEDFAPGPKAPEPTMVFLGRLKRYKRIERLFDVVEAVDGLSLDVVGDGDQDGELKAEARRRGVENRVRFHGHVGDERKAELLSRAWIAATASSAEGWSSATMEAAASGTPTVAHPVGGLKESIVHGQTGLHADSQRDFIEAARLLVLDAELRDRLGRQACRLGWDRSAEGTLAVLAEEAGVASSPDPVAVTA